jgi:general secretion pathway protein G
MRYHLRTLLIFLALASLVLAPMAFSCTRQKLSANPQQQSAVQSQLALLNQAVTLYQLDMGHLPSSLNNLSTLPPNLGDPKSWRGPYIEGSNLLLDPWGNPCGYKILDSGPDQFQLWSNGPDSRPGTADDVIARR